VLAERAVVIASCDSTISARPAADIIPDMFAVDTVITVNRHF
jgi:hypothetical protein